MTNRFLNPLPACPDISGKAGREFGGQIPYF